MKLIKDLGVIEHGKKGYRSRHGIYMCPDCNEEFKADTSKVKFKKTIKCSKCYKNDRKNKQYCLTHGDSKTKLYAIRLSMIQRCTNIKDKSYKNYGQRGISVCDEWTNDYLLFKEWALNNNYKQGLDIDRINNNGNYEPNNCHFITRKENLKNTRRSLYNRFTEDELSEIAETYFNSDINIRIFSKILNIHERVLTKYLKTIDNLKFNSASNNKFNSVGISFDKKYKKYRGRYDKNNKTFLTKRYTNIEDAIRERKEIIKNINKD